MKEFISKISNSEIRNKISGYTLLAVVAIIVLLMFVPIPPQNKEMVSNLINLFFGACVATVYQYLFGSSKNESDKNKTTE